MDVSIELIYINVNYLDYLFNVNVPYIAANNKN